MWLHVLGFVCCAFIILVAGRRLSFYGDRLAGLTGMGRAWIGLVLMAAVTSLPELMVGISSSALVVQPDLAVGNILGACALNLALLSVLDVFNRRRIPLFSTLSKTHILAASFSVMLLAIAGMGLFLGKDIILTPSLGLTSVAFAVVYFLSVRTIFRYQSSLSPRPNDKATEAPAGNMRQTVGGYALFAFVIILAALALPFFAEKMATGFGLSMGFTGTLFLAISTCMPEVSVSLASIRRGWEDLAVGNLLGSNIFNLFILFINDLAYTRGHLLKDASEGHLVSVLFVILMSGAAIIGLMYPSRQKRWLMSWDTFVILALYIFNIILLYNLS
ncbi:MAG TPA: hypothetical protein VK907_07850 [Phnomibacter sp.]|nr:hypothetical protein [Phnomibacter sp.]